MAEADLCGPGLLAQGTAEAGRWGMLVGVGGPFAQDMADDGRAWLRFRGKDRVEARTVSDAFLHSSDTGVSSLDSAIETSPSNQVIYPTIIKSFTINV